MGLIDLINQEEGMRKIFGQRELEIIKKQLLGINLSASEKTRLSRDIRPKLEIIKKISLFEKEFKLKKAQEINHIIKMTNEEILEIKGYPKIKKIYVFGSYVENKLRINSDIDIAVEFKSIEKKRASEFIIDSQGKINSKVQISVFNILPEKIKKEILNKGRIIYEYGKN